MQDRTTDRRHVQYMYISLAAQRMDVHVHVHGHPLGSQRHLHSRGGQLKKLFDHVYAYDHECIFLSEIVMCCVLYTYEN